MNKNLPEQGVSGPFRIVSIKHALPQKIPSKEVVENKLANNFSIRPVTGIFEHYSDKVLKVKFEGGDSIEVTENHPIYSKTAQRWQLAGELEVGEEVLTYHGSSKVASKKRLLGTHKVYNLEVKDLHNFLVNGSGVVVHNGYIIKECFDLVVDYLKTNVKYVGTLGKYGKNGSITGGHHPLAGKLFEADPKYVYDDALSVSKSTLEQIGGTGVHETITGKQKAGYNAWRAANPSPAKNVICRCNRN